MNFAEKMEIEASLLSNLASWMGARGEVIFDKSQSNAYTGSGRSNGRDHCTG